MATRLQALAAQIARLQARDPGGDRHRFQPPLSAREVEELERRLEVSLPLEYRRFLLEVSRGGLVTRLGPPHLMLPSVALAMLRRDRGRPAARFPLGRAVAARLMAARRTADGGAAAVARDLSSGVLPLMDRGGGTLDLLVLTGQQRGKVWCAWERGWSPAHARVRGRPRQHGFWSWLSERLTSD